MTKSGRKRSLPSFTYHAVGLIHSPYTSPDEIPKAIGEAPTAEGSVEIDPEFEEGLLGIEGFSHLLLIVAFHRSRIKPLRVTPPGQTKERGVFGTRSPHRPNAIGILTVELMGRRETTLFVRGLDVLDGTPVLDIKPYLKHFDYRPEAKQD